MKTFYSIFFLTILFSILNEVNAQQNIASLLHETIDMPYMAPSDKGTSPAYRYDSAGFFTTQVNVNIFGTNILGDAANEPSIAVDATNSNRIVIGWRQFDNVNSNFRQAGYAYSIDGGKTWVNRGVMIDPGNFRSDPVLASDDQGNFYYNSLGVNNNDMWTDVFRIVDGGFDWDNGTYAYGGDKQWMFIDKTQSAGNGNIYATWNRYYSICDGSFTRSVNNGDLYENCVEVDDDPYWGTLAVGPQGELYSVGVGDSYQPGVKVVKSETAQYSDSTITWSSNTFVNLEGYLTGWTDINPQGLLGQSWIDVDISDGPGRGYVYVLASVERSTCNDPGDVMFARSTDGGLTWDNPIKINTDTDHDNYQWMAAMSVAPDGRIDVVWLDTRDAPSNHPHYSALYYSYSIDHGETFSINEKLTPLFNPHLGYPQQQKMGDYFHMVSDLNGAHLAWAATFNGEEDVYYAHITPDVVTANKKIIITEEQIKLSLSPNPVVKNSIFNYSLLKSDCVTLEIFNSLGKKCCSLVNKIENKGLHSVKINRDMLSCGIYIAVLKSGNEINSIKFVVN
jgi:hypothetical protein